MHLIGIAPLALCVLAVASLHALLSMAQKDNVHTAFLTDCTEYSDWQSIGMVYSWKHSGQPGPITRVMCCTEAEAKSYNKGLINYVKTHIAPSFAVDTDTGDNYAAYNKPGAVIDWLDHVTPDEEWIVVLDSDMIMRHPFTSEIFNVTRGWAVGARYDYMIGVDNDLAVRHIPEIPPRNDTLAGPFGRRGDKVGGFFFIHRDDLKRMSHLWLKYTKDVRQDPEAWRLSGDHYSKHAGDKPWISEMYGYSFGAAKADVWHKWDEHSMIYPGYAPGGIPKVLHYGLLFEVEGFKFDKHWHYDFDVYKCPPWDFTPGKKRTHGLFDPPPHPSTLTAKDYIEKYKDLMSIQVIATINAGLCEFHLKNCEANAQLLDECKQAVKLFRDTKAALKAVEEVFDCADHYDACKSWAKNGECQNNPTFMAERCSTSCNKCKRASSIVVQEKSSAEVIPGQDNAAADGGQATGQSQAKDKSAVAQSPVVAAVLPVQSDTSGGQVDLPAKINPGRKRSRQGGQQQQQQQQVVAESPAVGGGGDAQAANGGSTTEAPTTAPDARPPPRHGSVKEMMRRCYRMSKLTMEQVRACVAAAKRGEAYGDDADVNPPKEVTLDTKSEEDLGAGLEARELKQELKVQETPSPSLLVVDNPPRPRMSRSTWQALALWLVVVSAFLYGIPRLMRRRRMRSGMRSE